MTDKEGQDINDLIQRLHRVSLDKQRAANEEWKQRNERRRLAAKETKLIQNWHRYNMSNNRQETLRLETEW